jgi:hypothetical protein
MPGTTGATPSSDVFNEIRTNGETAIAVGAASKNAASKNDAQGLGTLGSWVAGRKYFRA